MTNKLINPIVGCSLIFASVFAVTFSTLPQSWVLLLLFIAICASLKSSKLKQLKVKSCTFLWVMTFGGIYILMRGYFSISRDLAVQDMFILSAFLFGFTLAFLNKKNHSFENVILTVISFLVVLNLLMFIPHLNEFRDNIMGYASGKWNTGFFNHRNFYSNFMALCSCILLSKALFSEVKTKKNWIYLLLSIGASVAVLISLARGGTVGLVIGLGTVSVFYIVTRSKERVKFSKWFIIIISILAFSMILIGANWVFEKRQMELGRDDRTFYYSMAVDQIMDSPVAGSGSRSIEYKSYQYWHPRLYRSIDFRFTHNEYLQMAADYGLIGLILMIWAFISYLIAIGAKVRVKVQNRLNIWVDSAGVSCLSVMAINSFVSFPMHAFPNMLLLGLIMGLAFPSNYNKEKDFKKSKTVYALIISLVIISCCIMPYIVKEIVASTIFLKKGLVVDDANWLDANNEDSRWEVALIEATQFSPTYVRQNRLGYIYFFKYEQSGKKEFLDKAKTRFLKAKERHPEDPYSRINLADILSLQGNLEESITEYKALEPMVSRREINMNVLLKTIRAKLELAFKKAAENETEVAIDLLRSALSQCRSRYKLLGGRTDVFLGVYEQVILKKLTLLSVEVDKLEYYSLINEYIKISKARNFVINAKYASVMSMNLNKMAQHVWTNNRDPQFAINILHHSWIILCRVRSSNSEMVSNLEWIKAKEANRKMWVFLSKAGFKPELK